MKDLENILELARSVGWGAADILRSYYHQTDDKLEVQYKQNEPVTIADVNVNRYILENLQAVLGKEDFAYISEETYKGEHVKQEWVWIIDPLDGTRDFIEKTGEYAIHIALVQGTRPVLAVVAVPEAEKLYYATKGGGAFVETGDTRSVSPLGYRKTLPLQVSSRERIEDLTLVVSRSHRNERLNYLLQHLPCQNQKAVGSVGGKIAAIVEQRADIYISLSGKSAPKDWDIAAPELILIEAGGQFTHFDGTPLQYNTGDVNQWGGLLASNGQYHQMLCRQAESILAQYS
jgi:3'(2'), 5'-bisphosphate nucleotidase